MSSARDRAILRELERGDTQAEIAARHGLTVGRVSQIAIAAGARRHTRMTPELEARVVELLEAGCSQREIRAELGIARATIYRIARRT